MWLLYKRTINISIRTVTHNHGPIWLLHQSEPYDKTIYNYVLDDGSHYEVEINDQTTDDVHIVGQRSRFVSRYNNVGKDIK